MNRYCEKVIGILSQAIENRRLDEIDQVIDWLRTSVSCLRTEKSDLISEVVRLGLYKKCLPGEVVTPHTDDDESFYIILSGVANVYVPPKQKSSLPQSFDAGSEVEREAFIGKSQQKHPSFSVDSTSDLASRVGTETSYGELTRRRLGRLTARIGVGKCFGGSRRRTNDPLKNAAFVCDETLHLLHLTEDAFNRTIKPSQEQELLNRQRFISEHPLFSGWSPKLRQLLEVNLVKQIHSPGQSIVRQSEPYDGLIFILSGRANVSVEPGKHRNQYGHLPVFTSQSEDIQNEKPRKRKKTEVAARIPPSTLRPVVVRRRLNYADAESKLRRRRVNLCFVETGEIVGDVELVSKLDSYCQTVSAIETVETYTLNAKTIDRIGVREFAESVNRLKFGVETKLAGRVERLKAQVPQLFPYLLTKLRYVNAAPPERLPSLVTSKSLPSEDMLFQHLLKSFLDSKSSLVRPYVSGGLFYLDLMRSKAKARRSSPEFQKASALAEEKVKRQNRQPLSTRAIKEALRRQENELVMVEETARLHEIRSREERRTMDEWQRLLDSCDLGSPTADSTLLTEKALMGLQQLLINKMRQLSYSEDPNFDETFETQSWNGPDQKSPTGDESFNPFCILKTGEGSTKTLIAARKTMPGDAGPCEQAKATVPVQRESETHPGHRTFGEVKDSEAVETTAEGEDLQESRKDVQERGGLTEPIETLPPTASRITSAKDLKDDDDDDEEGKQRTIATGEQHVDLRSVEDDLSASMSHAVLLDQMDMKIQRTRTFLSGCENQSDPGDVRKDKTDNEEREVHSARAELNRFSRVNRAPKENGSQKKNNEDRRTKEAVVLALAKNLSEERARNKLNKELMCAEDALYDSPLYRDWETSDRSLQYLEKRIARFHRETDREVGKGETQPKFLPKLKRFEPTDDQPKHTAPGGKVYVKRRACDIRKAKGVVVKDHNHVRYHLLPSIPNYNQLRTSKLVMFQMLDDARRQWSDE